jgi:hypothetical protein
MDAYWRGSRRVHCRKILRSSRRSKKPWADIPL